MFENLRDTQALFWIDLQQSSDEVLGLFRDFFLHVVLGLQDLLVEVLHVVSFEWHCSEEESKQNYTCTPEVSLEALVALISDDLWGNVGWCATLLKHGLSLFDRLGDAKISYLDMALAVKQDVVQLDVSVQDLFRVDVANTLYDLLEENLRKRLLKLFPFPHEVEQIAASAQLHHQHDMSPRLESLV